MRGFTKRKLGEQQPALSNASMQGAVGRWVRHVNAGSENGCRSPSSIERRTVRHAVDSARHPTHDACARAREGGRELARDALSIGRGYSGSYDSDHRSAQGLPLANEPERHRRVRETLQLVGKGRVTVEDKSSTRATTRVEQSIGRFDNSRPLLVAYGVIERPRGGPKSCHELAARRAPDALDEREREYVALRGVGPALRRGHLPSSFRGGGTTRR